MVKSAWSKTQKGNRIRRVLLQKWETMPWTQVCIARCKLPHTVCGSGDAPSFKIRQQKVQSTQSKVPLLTPLYCLSSLTIYSLCLPFPVIPNNFSSTRGHCGDNFRNNWDAVLLVQEYSSGRYFLNLERLETKTVNSETTSWCIGITSATSVKNCMITFSIFSHVYHF